MRVRTWGDSSFGGGWTPLELSPVPPGPPRTTPVHQLVPLPTNQLVSTTCWFCWALCSPAGSDPFIALPGATHHWWTLRDIRDGSGRSDPTRSRRSRSSSGAGSSLTCASSAKLSPLQREWGSAGTWWFRPQRTGARTPLWPDQPGFSSLVSHQLASVPRTHRRSPLARFGPNRARTGREGRHTHGTRWRVLGRSGRGSPTSTGRRSSSDRGRRPASISPLLAQRSLHLCSSAKKTITTSSKRRLSLSKRARPRRKTGPGPSAVRRVGAGPPGSVPTHF